jgi:N4-gp56 family major capsid protein
MNKFTNTNNVTNPGDSISANTLQSYNRNLLRRAVEEFVISKFTAKKTQPKFEGKTAVFSVYDQIPATAFTTAVLPDGVTPAETDLTKKSVTANIANYGAYTSFSDEVSLYHEDGAVLIKEATDNLGAGAGTAIESLLFAEAEANAGIDFLTTPEADTETGLDKAETQLRINLAKKFKSMITGSTNTDTKTIRECYVAFINPADILAIEALTGFVSVDKYGYSDGLIMNEIGSRRGLRFVETNNAAQGQITILGEEALGEVSVRGKGKIQTLVKGLGSAGSADPLNQRQSVGCKFAIAPKMLRPEWAAKVAIV